MDVGPSQCRSGQPDQHGEVVGISERSESNRNPLFSYGVRINTSLVKDLYAAKIPVATGTVGNQPQFKNLAWFFHPLANGNPNHPNYQKHRTRPFAVRKPDRYLKKCYQKDPFIGEFGTYAEIRHSQFCRITINSRRHLLKLTYQDGNQLFAVLLEGDFKSAYKNRMLPFQTPLYKANANQNKMIVISDGDVGKNQILKKEPYDLARDKWTR